MQAVYWFVIIILFMQTGCAAQPASSAAAYSQPPTEIYLPKPEFPNASGDSQIKEEPISSDWMEIPEQDVPDEVESYEESIQLPGGTMAPAADFLFPYSGQSLLTQEEIEEKLGTLDSATAKLLSQRAVNELYARYGYNFHPEKSDTAKDAYDYFHTLEWYNSICHSNTAGSIGEVPLNRTEQANRDALVEWQRKKGFR